MKAKQEGDQHANLSGHERGHPDRIAFFGGLRAGQPGPFARHKDNGNSDEQFQHDAAKQQGCDRDRRQHNTGNDAFAEGRVEIRECRHRTAGPGR